MAIISQFTPLRYNPDLVPDLGAVIAPPYDVISPAKHRELTGRDGRNVVRLILPDGEGDTKYPLAAGIFRDWIASGVLVRDALPGIWLYRQAFDHPVSGDRIERLGFISLLHLEPFSAGIVLPHERTLSGPKADRLKLMEATDANLEPIFGVYPDNGSHSGARLRSLAAGMTPIVEATDADGVEHTLWHVTAEAPVAGIVSDLADKPVFIVDGHHRYETALNYQTRHREQSGSSAPAPYDWIMIFLAPMSDPGLVILPTHRIVHSLPEFDFDALLGRLGDSFEVIDQPAADVAMAELESHPETPAFLLASGERFAVARLRTGAAADLVGEALPPALRELDVTILHEYILERQLGVSKEAQAAQTNLEYVKTNQDALDALRRPEVQLVVMMNATRLEQVEEVALSGEVMPQKSTFFYPKLASGLLFNTLA